MDGPTEIAVGGPDFSFRKRSDGGYTVTQRGALGAPLMLDHLLIGMRYLHMLRHQRSLLRINLGKDFLDDIRLPRRWGPKSVSPFERIRTMDPQADESINAEAIRNLVAAWPVFKDMVVQDVWAGMMDITPDSLPAIERIDSIQASPSQPAFPATVSALAQRPASSPPISSPMPRRSLIRRPTS